MRRQRSQLLIFTGKSGCGKTSLLRDMLKRHNQPVQGFLSMKRFEEGQITGITLVILPGNKLFHMATTTPIYTDISSSNFYFFPRSFEYVNRHFRTMRHGYPFIFDEFGLLECEKKGHYPVFTTLIRTFHPSLIVVRSSLLEELLSSLPSGTDPRIVDLRTTDNASAYGEILTFLKKSP